MTTAAAVWIAATLGIACGLAQWNLVLIGGAIALIVLVGFKWLAKFLCWDLDRSCADRRKKKCPGVL